MDTAHAPLVMCSNKGKCDLSTGICACQVGYEGMACHRMSCPLSCSNHGRCKSMKFLAATDNNRNSEYVKESANSAMHTATTYNNYLYTGVWDHDKIFGCECDEGYMGYDCSLRYCPTGDDPLTTGQVDEVQTIVCSGTDAFTVTFRGYTSEDIAATSTSIQMQAILLKVKMIQGITVGFTGQTQACTAGAGTTIALTFTQNFGNLPLVTVDSSAGAGVQKNTMTVARTRACTKEELPCANRGVCDYLTGVCTCTLNFRTSDGIGNQGVRGDCGNAKGSITACPGETACMGHGVCAGSPTYRCSCSAGYTGAECSERLCSADAAWFDRPSGDNKAHSELECSNMGICDRAKGQCTCNEGFNGGACQYVLWEYNGRGSGGKERDAM